MDKTAIPPETRQARLARTRLSSFAAKTAFVLLSSAIVVVSSEKFYWYPQGFSASGFVELVLFYSLGIMAAFLAISRYRIHNLSGVVLASGIYALVVEGIVTPVLYEDGVLPLLALYFFAWHGLISFMFCWYLARRWAISNQRKRLALWSTVYGVFWGIWSVTYWLPDSIADMQADLAAGDGTWDPGQWPVAKFSLYAITFTAVLMAAHWLLGFVWPTDWHPTKRWTVGIGGLLLAGMALITFAIPWAPLKLGALGWILVIALRRASGSTDARSIFASMAGRASFGQLAPLVMLAAGAITAYSVLSLVNPSDSVLRAIYWSTVSLQIASGATASAVLFVRVRSHRG